MHINPLNMQAGQCCIQLYPLNVFKGFKFQRVLRPIAVELTVLA